MPRMSHSAVLIFSLTFLVASASAGSLRFAGKTFETNTLPSLTPEQVGQRAKNVDAITVVVQFSQPVTPTALLAIERAGGTVNQYLPDYAYLVTIAALDADQLTSVPGVSWVGFLPNDAKVSNALKGELAKAGAKAVSTPVEYVVLSVDLRAVKELEGKGYLVSETRLTPMGWYESRVSASLAKALDVSGADSVFRVETTPDFVLHGEREAQTTAGNQNAGGTGPVGTGYTNWMLAQGLTGGAGLVVQVQDDGLDKGIATNLPGTAHVDLLGRILGITNATSDLLGDSKAGHGQINAGIIIGNATVGTLDPAGYKLGQGIAPAASVYATKIFRNNGEFDMGATTFAALAKQAQDAGARFSNNSWGASVDGEYTSDAAEFDALVRDSDATELGNQPMAYFFSAGNDGPANGTLGSPGSAKNVITVGAAENSDANGTDGCGVNSADSSSNRDLVPFSSRGPTLDGRFGITLVAVGTHVSGPASTVAGYDGSGVCDMYWPAGQTNYARSSGTSHSAPIAAGAGMLVYELFKNQLSILGHTASPSPAMLRAVLTNTATNIAGGSDGNGGTLANIPNPQQGWGAVNLNPLMSMKDALYTVDQTHVFTATNQIYEVTLRRVNAAKPIKVSLAWTDAPAVPGTAVNLVNDLDLEVVNGASTFRGNVFVNGASATGGTADRANNLEAVYLNSPANDTVTIRVKARNIAGNGVPNVGGNLDQDFALFVWNASSQNSAGTVSASPELISCNDQIVISVSDQDLRGAETVDVQIESTTGDVEVVTIEETDVNSGVFAGTVNSGSGPVAANGVVDVSNGATVTVVYFDELTNTGQSAIVEDAIAVDCAPPTISSVQVSGVYSNQFTVTFATNEASTSTVGYGPSCAAATQIRQGGDNTTQHSAVLTGLSPTTAYYYKVSATDSAGNTAVANGGGCYTFTTPARPDFFTEVFGSGDNDLDNQSILLTPSATLSGYTACRSTASTFPTDPNGGTILNLADDGFQQISLTGGKTFPLYGVSYTSVYVASNGYVTFGSGSEEYAESPQTHFQIPRISGHFDDLSPDAQHPVRYQQLSDRVAVTWVNVTEFNNQNSNNFQIEMYFDGKIRITHLQMQALDGIVGLSKGQGAPADFVESDFSAYALCFTNYTISGSVTLPGGGGLAGVTLNGLPGNPVTNASGAYTATVIGGFSGTVTPQLGGYTFDPATMAYSNVSGNMTQQNYVATQAQLSVTPSQSTVGAAAGTKDLTVSNVGTGTMSWTTALVGGPAWASIQSGASGTNGGTIRIALTANTSMSSRTLTVRVTASGAINSPTDVTITQEPNTALAVTPLARNVGYLAGTTTFDIANAGAGTMNWTAEVVSGGAWLAIASGASGANSGTVTAACLQNFDSQRTGTIRITATGAVNSPIDVTVTQASAPQLVVTPLQRDLGAGSGSVTFDVSVLGGSGVAWSAMLVTGNWLAITSVNNGVDNGQITVSYGSNPGSTSRTGTIQFTALGTTNSPIVVTLTQASFGGLRVVTPNGGEAFKRGKRMWVQWTTVGTLTGNVSVELFRNGMLVQTLKSNIKNDGRIQWTVPSNFPTGNGYQVRVISESQPAIFDMSDDTFKIK